MKLKLLIKTFHNAFYRIFSLEKKKVGEVSHEPGTFRSKFIMKVLGRRTISEANSGSPALASNLRNKSTARDEIDQSLIDSIDKVHAAPCWMTPQEAAELLRPYL